MNGFIIGAALGAALVGAGEHDWSQYIARPQSEATSVLEKQCGLYASSARGSKDPLAYDFGSLAVVSATMNDNSNIKLSDRITRLLGSDLDKFNREEPAIGNLIWDIAARSAKCGAAFGLVASGR